MNMTDFINSNFIKAEDLTENVLIEAVIADVKRKEFEENGEIVIKAARSGQPLTAPQDAQILRGSIDILGGRGAWDDQPPSAPPPDHYDGPDGPDIEINDSIEI
jgi:hypothetical protein